MPIMALIGLGLLAMSFCCLAGNPSMRTDPSLSPYKEYPEPVFQIVKPEQLTMSPYLTERLVEPNNADLQPGVLAHEGSPRRRRPRGEFSACLN